jgi:hypothetical protein
MKTSSKVILVIGLLLLLMQYGAYKGSNFEFPPLYNGEGSIVINAGTILGFNFFGIIGLLLVIIAWNRKPKSK